MQRHSTPSEWGRIRLQRDAAYKLLAMCQAEISELGELRSSLRDGYEDFDTNQINREQKHVKRIAAEVERLISEKNW